MEDFHLLVAPERRVIQPGLTISPADCCMDVHDGAYGKCFAAQEPQADTHACVGY